MTSKHDDGELKTVRDDFFAEHRAVRELMRSARPPSEVQNVLDALIRSRTALPPLGADAIVQSSLTFLAELGLLSAWRANPLCLRCGLPGDLAISDSDERGVFCSLCAGYTGARRQPMTLASWLADLLPRMRPSRRKGRPTGSGRALSDEEFPDRYAHALAHLRKRGIDPTDERIADARDGPQRGVGWTSTRARGAANVAMSDAETPEAREGEGSQRPARPWIEWTMFALAVAMVPLVVLQESSEAPDVILWTERLSGLIWLAFLAEYIYLLSLADNRRRFIRAHWFDLFIIVLTPPIALFPNELDVLRALRALRVIRVFAVLARANHTLRRFLRRDGLPYLLALSLFVVLLGGLTIHALEPENAPSVGDGLWWAAATLSTVGYGDIAPKTIAGRILAVVIMIIGVGTFAIMTAAIASRTTANTWGSSNFS